MCFALAGFTFIPQTGSRASSGLGFGLVILAALIIGSIPVDALKNPGPVR
jgi:hypothetical protein